MDGTPYLFVVELSVPAALEDKFNDLYDRQHIPAILTVPGVRSCRRFKLEWSEPANRLRYLAIYEVDDPELPQSAAWRAASNRGDWATEMRPYIKDRRSSMFRAL